jgi:two-component system response regulator NreC
MLSTPSKCCRVLLADDHAIVRDGLRAVLQEEGFEIAGEASDGLGAIKLSEELSADVALLDVSMPLLNGIDAAREILKVSPKTYIILLTMRDDERSVLAGLRAGVKGYVLKSKAASDLIDAIQAVRKGEIYLSPGVSNRIVEAYLAKDDTPADPLSVRERQVLQLLAEGKNVKEVGDILHISTKTAESHRANIMNRLDVHDLAGLVRYAIGQGLVSVL